MQKCIWKLNIKRHFLSTPTNNSIVNTQSDILHSGLSNPSLFNPPGNTAPAINVFRNLVLNDLEKLPNKRIHQDPKIQIGLKSLCEKKNLIICPAYKGGGIVVLDKDTYIQEMKRLLDDHTTYSLLPGDPTSNYKKALIEIVDKGFALNILNKKEKDFLVPLAPRIPIIYQLPKIHKDPINPLGPPIVSRIN